jgi:Uma2 family endonuclease
MEPLRNLSDPMTADEFRSWPGDGRGGKYQLVDGELRAVSPASAVHSAIQANLARMIGNHLTPLGGPCRAYTEPAIEVRINAAINTRVPDVGVSCARLTPQDFALPDPILLIEILSPGNKADTWTNVWAYCTIPTVKEILILAGTRIEADLLRRDEQGNWPANPMQIGPDGTLTLATIDYTVPLGHIYAGTFIVDATNNQ